MWEMVSLKNPENPFAEYNLTEKKRLVLRKGKASVKDIKMRGRLIGGCLDTLLTLIGTDYDKVSEFIVKYRRDGIIWFLESCDLNVFQIRRGLWQMKQAGWFNGAVGFIFGRPMHFDEPEMGLDRHLAVTSQLEYMGVPLVMDADIGHLPPSMPIISGAVAEVNVTDGNISIEYYFK